MSRFVKVVIPNAMESKVLGYIYDNYPVIKNDYSGHKMADGIKGGFVTIQAENPRMLFIYRTSRKSIVESYKTVISNKFEARSIVYLSLDNDNESVPIMKKIAEKFNGWYGEDDTMGYENWIKY